MSAEIHSSRSALGASLSDEELSERTQKATQLVAWEDHSERSTDLGIEEHKVIKKPGPSYLWRGAAGGLLGSVIWVLSIPSLHHGNGYKSYYYIIVFAYTLPIGIFIGGLVGAIMAWLHQTKPNGGPE